MFYFLLENATQGVPISFLLPGTSKIEHELQIEIELSNPRLKNGPLLNYAIYFQPIELGPRNTGAYKDDDTVIDTVRRRLSSLKEKKRESSDRM